MFNLTFEMKIIHILYVIAENALLDNCIKEIIQHFSNHKNSDHKYEINLTFLHGFLPFDYFSLYFLLNV